MVSKLGRLLSMAVLAASAWGSDAGQTDTSVYVTWEAMEPDKCAVLWLIRTYLDPTARFVFIPPDSEPPPGTLFDVPEAEIRRTHNQSAFEVLVQLKQLSGSRIDYVGRLMHDIEINTWRRKALPETRSIEAEILSQINDIPPADAVARCVRFFDQLALPR